MGDRRYEVHFRRVRAARDPAAEIRAMGDEELVQALAACPSEEPYLSNVLATEILNRLRRHAAAREEMARQRNP